MLSYFNRARSDERGFSLAELLAVIAIVGILAAIAVPLYLNHRQRANDAAVLNDVKNVANAMETLAASNPADVRGSFDNVDIPATAANGGVPVPTGVVKTASHAPTSAMAAVSVPTSEGVIIMAQSRADQGPGAFSVIGYHPENGKQYTLTELESGGVAADVAKYESWNGGFVDN